MFFPLNLNFLGVFFFFFFVLLFVSVCVHSHFFLLFYFSRIDRTIFKLKIQAQVLTDKVFRAWFPFLCFLDWAMLWTFHVSFHWLWIDRNIGPCKYCVCSLLFFLRSWVRGKGSHKQVAHFFSSQRKNRKTSPTMNM